VWALPCQFALLSSWSWQSLYADVSQGSVATHFRCGEPLLSLQCSVVSVQFSSVKVSYLYSAIKQTVALRSGSSWNQNALSARLTLLYVISSSRRRAGRLLQIRDPATVKLLSPNVFCVRGTWTITRQYVIVGENKNCKQYQNSEQNLTKLQQWTKTIIAWS